MKLQVYRELMKNLSSSFENRFTNEGFNAGLVCPGEIKAI
jgi:hypothetical protein